MPKEEPIDFVFLDGHVFKLPSKYLCLYPWICAVLHFGQRR